jgi:hypothetical protein
MALLGTFTKQPAEVLDFSIDYTAVLAGRSDSIVTKAVVSSPAGMTIPSSTITGGNKITVVVAGGTTATTYLVTVTATSNATPTALVYEDEVEVEVLEVS